jgi:hypothetical protein
VRMVVLLQASLCVSQARVVMQRHRIRYRFVVSFC